MLTPSGERYKQGWRWDPDSEIGLLSHIMSSHPFLVDQRPYLPRHLSTESFTSNDSHNACSSCGSRPTSTTSSRSLSGTASSSSSASAQDPAPDLHRDYSPLLYSQLPSNHMFGSVSIRKSQTTRNDVQRSALGDLEDFTQSSEEEMIEKEKKKKSKGRRFGGLF
ncbi:hypothetical protein BD324DRAFT_639676 [Kockovaella imperatae]|uniref:Uncharacterized protein n=1 Tax=Kockovaella imperatae TaxID=4999 RepID=A0A1Y1U669_9TREE|nr:hypothetical protein BD324DRAFT_639676 [Kockovaella imperatae]ORX33531.1 hypothetical protein BD324DRAFT_639676 [Kockovaella imperatae]